tara:strand:+ start:1306 stop:1935 length:630 start_codon:yes stop_codon:yes gene_type:complete
LNKSANFSNIHKFYDVINSLITFGFDKSWRRQAAENLKLGNVLDLGSGTGASYYDLKKYNVVALDPDESMLSLNKFEKKVVGKSENLPFDDNYFDNIFCCFVLRNVENIDNTFNEVRRVLKKDGKFILLDMSRPRNNVLKQFHKIGTYIVLHLIGLVTLNLKEYRFLHFSLDKLPPPEDFLIDINLEQKILKRMGIFGFVYLGVFEKKS